MYFIIFATSLTNIINVKVCMDGSDNRISRAHPISLKS